MTSLCRHRDAGRTTADLLEAAEHEFAELGFAGARVDRIARRAGCNKGLIFQRFGDKAGIYAAVFTAVLDRWRPSPDELAGLLRADSREAFVGSVEALVDRTVRFLLAEPRAARILLWEVASGWAVLGAPAAHEHRERSLGPIRDFLDAAQRSGFLRPDLSPQVQLGLVTQIPMLLNALRFDLADPALRGFVTEFVVSGLVVPATPPDPRPAR